MTDNLDIKDKLDKDIQKLKELKNEQVVAVAKGGEVKRKNLIKV